MKGFCPHCQKEIEVTLRQTTENYSIKGHNILVNVEYFICNNCNEDFSTPGQMDKCLNEGFNKYRQIENIIFPDEIIKIREKYGASQKAFAKILALGELTINSYEQGSLPSKSVSNLIKLMEKIENFTELFEKNKHQLSKRQIQKIESTLSHEQVVCCHIDPDSMIEVHEKYTGYGRPDWEKLILVWQLILSFAQKKLYKMVILKISFYIDFAFYKHNIRSITGWPYARLPFGPVPDEWKMLINVAIEENKLTYEPDEAETGDLFLLPESFQLDTVQNSFSDSEIEMIKTVTKALKEKSATELKELTHEEEAWIKTQHAAKIDYALALKLKLF